MRLRAEFGVLACVIAGVLGGSGVSQAGGAPTRVRVSGPSPYTQCGDAGQYGHPITNAETEPFVAANPIDPLNLIGVFQQDRWDTGGSRGNAAAYSRDGGTTWTRTTLPFSKCAPRGVAFDRASDPWVSIGPDGVAYAIGLSFDVGLDGSGGSGIVTAVSRDRGATWGRVRIVRQNPDGFTRFNDKESITADPTRYGSAYATWDVAIQSGLGAFRQPTLFSRTTDWGKHWSTPIAIAGTAMDEASVDNIVVVDPIDGSLFDFYAFFYCTCDTIPRIEYVKSTDGGRTWSQRHVVAAFDSVGVVDPYTGAPLRTGDAGPSVAIDPGDGTLYAAWQSGRFSGGKYDEIALSVSRNHGRTWSEPRRVNRPTGHPAFLAGIHVSLSDALGITYYDLRDDSAATPSLPTNVWLRTSWDHGTTWTRDQHVMGPFNFGAAPLADGGHFIGDYIGLTDSAGTFVPFFTATNCMTACPRNRTDVYAARIRPLPPSAPSSAGSLGVPGWIAGPTRAIDVLANRQRR